MKYYNTLIPVGEYFKVVIPEMKEPIESDYTILKDRSWNYSNAKEHWEDHIKSLPPAALTKSNKQGWMENVVEEWQYQGVDDRWYNCSENARKSRPRRIILVEETVLGIFTKAYCEKEETKTVNMDYTAYRLYKNDKVNSLLSTAMRELDMSQLVALKDALVERTPSGDKSEDGWISVKDRLPKVEDGDATEVIINSRVIGAETENVTLCGVFYKGKFYIASEWNGQDNDEDTITPIPDGRISHWRPLPKPPQGGE